MNSPAGITITESQAMAAVSWMLAHFSQSEENGRLYWPHLVVVGGDALKDGQAIVRDIQGDGK